VRIAFYAPMKAPTHPTPSGDRRMAQLIMAALEVAGHDVQLASTFRSYDGKGVAARQAELETAGHAETEQLIEAWQNLPADKRPDLWVTYHLYHKAPDWLGPAVSAALNIPYVVAEASYARKQARGPYARNLAVTAQAIARAQVVLSITPEDEDALRPLVAGPDSLMRLPPFVDTAPYDAAHGARTEHRSELAAQYGLDPDKTWLITVGMMRPGDKLASYRLLGRALWLIADPEFHLLVIGDGDARSLVHDALDPLGENVAVFLGAQDAADLPGLYAAADLFVWPAYNEAYGMALLEAQATGLPVVAGGFRGVPEVVADSETGTLIAPWSDIAFAEAVVQLTRDSELRDTFSQNARTKVANQHSLTAASSALEAALERAVMLHQRQHNK